MDPADQGLGPALAEGAQPRRVLRGSTVPLPGSPAGEAVPGGRGAGPPHPTSLTSGASAEQHGGGEGQQEQQQQAGEESHGVAGQRPLRVR